MVKYLGELEDDDLVMFVLEHLKDHKSPQKLVEGLEPVSIRKFLLTIALCTDVLLRFSKKRPLSSLFPYGAKSSMRVWHIAMDYIRRER